MEGTKLTGLWKGKDRNGKTYLSGSVNAAARLVVLPNDFKRTEKDPDFYAYLTPHEKKAPGTSAPAQDDLL